MGKLLEEVMTESWQKIQQSKEEKDDPGKRNRGSEGLEIDKSTVHSGTYVFLELAEKGCGGGWKSKEQASEDCGFILKEWRCHEGS